MLIVYCDACGLRVPESDIQAGRAVRDSHSNKLFCAKCQSTSAKAQSSPAPANPQAEARKTPASGEARKTPISGVARPVKDVVNIVPRGNAETGRRSGMKLDSAVTAKTKSSRLMPALAACSALVVIMALMFWVLRAKPVPNAHPVAQTTVPQFSEPAPKQQLTAPETDASNINAPGALQKDALAGAREQTQKLDQELVEVRTARAAKLLDEHKTWFQRNAGDARGYNEKLATLVESYRDTPAAQEATKLMAELKIPDERAGTPIHEAHTVIAPKMAAEKSSPVANKAIAAQANTQNNKAGPAAAGAQNEAEASLEYEKTLGETYSLLSKNSNKLALARLEKAKSEPKLAALSAALDHDIQFLKYMDDVDAAAVKGAALLTDKRAFLFKKLDGNALMTGKGGVATVLAVNGETLTLEQDIGGGKVTSQLPFDQLTPETHYELARLSLAGADSEVKLASAAMVLLQAGSSKLTPKMIRYQLQAAKGGDVPADMVSHLLGRLDAIEREQSAEAAIKKLDVSIKEKRSHEAKAAIEAVRKEFAGTVALATLQPTLEQRLADVEYQLNPMQPGLWGSYWSGDGGDKFKTFHFARADSKLCYDWKTDGPGGGVPRDFFGVRWGGKLRIGHEGKYRFKASADDFIEVWMDGAKALENNKEKDLFLARGEHEIKIVYWQQQGPASMSIHWKISGSKNWLEFPTEALWYDVKQTEAYQKN